MSLLPLCSTIINLLFRLTSTFIFTGESKNASAAQTGPLYDPKGTGMSTPEHAGFLLAMGLQGHLKHGIKKPDVHDYLKARHSLTTMAILLGEASTHRGTMDLGKYSKRRCEQCSCNYR